MKTDPGMTGWQSRVQTSQMFAFPENMVFSDPDIAHDRLLLGPDRAEGRIMNLKIGLAAAVATALISLSTPASAQTFGTLTVTEDSALGWTGVVPTSQTPVTIASDGENAFTPFGLTFDVSDAIKLSVNWAPDPAYSKAFGPNGWQQAPGTFVWYLAACSGHVCENGNVHEPIGKWDFLPLVGWSSGAMNIRILDSHGAFSDYIGIANDGQNGGATVSFQSGVPEPASWAMMLVGFGGLGAVLRRRRSHAAFAAA